MMKLLVKTDKSPAVTFEPNRVTIQANGTVTAYAIQPDNKLTPLFILNLVGYSTGSDPLVSPRQLSLLLSTQETSVSARVFLSGMKVAAALTLNK